MVEQDFLGGVHVIVGESAGGTLRMAFPGHSIECVVDNLSVGPLHADPTKHAALRQAYWEQMDCELGPDPDAPPPRSYDMDTHMVERVRVEMRRGRPLILWMGGWAFERIACAWLIYRLLSDAPNAQIYLVDSDSCLSILPPSTLSSLGAKVLPLIGAARVSALDEWSAIHTAPVPTFRWHSADAQKFCTMPDKPWRTVLNTPLHGDDGSEVDARIMEQVTQEWRRAVLVVGHVLADCPTSDRVLHWHIARLCRSGQLEYEGELHALRHFRLRRT